MELLEHRFALVLRNAAAGVGDVDADGVAAMPGADQHAAGAGVAQSVGQDILQDAAQQRAVGAHEDIDWAEFQRQALLLRFGKKVRAQRGKQRLQADVADFGLHHAGVELGDVEQRAQQVFHRLQRALDLAHQLPAFIAGLDLGERRDRQMRGIQRLQHIVAGGGEEPGLGEVRQFGILLRRAEIDVRLLEPAERRVQFLGAVAHPVFQRNSSLEQREGVALLVHRTLDAADESGVDLLQLLEVVDVAKRHLLHSAAWRSGWASSVCVGG